MPALDFPATPADGDIFGNWVYSSGKQAWQSRPLTPAKTVNSPVAPSNPAAGDQWFNTDTGQLFIYYTDANTSQWVESRAPITADGYVSPNYIINGGFDIWQRGTSFTAQLTDTKANTADRWNANASSTTAFTVSRQTVSDPLIPNIQYSLRFQRNSGSAVGNSMNMVYNFESSDSIPLAGKTVTFSFYARRGENYSQTSSSIAANLRSGTGIDGNIYTSWPGSATVASFTPTLTTSWQRFQVTGSVNPAARQLGILLVAAPSGTAGANDWFEITGVQVEEGSVATPFRRNANSVAGELAACQRYALVLPSNPLGAGFYIGTGVVMSSTSTRAFISFPVSMRRAPDSILPYTSATSFNVELPGTVTQNSTALSNVSATPSALSLNVDYPSNASYTAGRAAIINVNGAPLVITAEL
jgi:hypothetical protein